MQFCFLFAALGGVCYGSVQVDVPKLPNITTHRYDSLQAQFGPTLPQIGQDFILAAAEPIDACGDVKMAHAPAQGYAALIKRTRGDTACGFELKVQVAQEAGFDAVIVYDDAPKESLVSMRGEGGETKIPAVFVSNAAGLQMLNVLAKVKLHQNVSVIVNITPDPSPSWPSFVTTFIVLISTGILMFTVFMYFRRRRYRRESATLRLNPCDIEKFTVRVQGPDTTDDTCCICLAEYDEGEKILILPCNHEFHKDCIVPWLTERRRVCPICKRDPEPSEGTPLLTDSSETTPLLVNDDISDSDSESFDSSIIMPSTEQTDDD